MSKKSAGAKGAKKKKKGGFGKFLKVLFVGLFLVSAAGLTYWFWPMSDRDIFDFVPEDACYVLEADDPINNWKDFSKTDIWKALKKNALFADIEADANYLDTLIMDNERIFNLISGKKLLIVSQMYKADDYDFLYLIDLKKGAKVSFFMDIFKGIMSTMGMNMQKKELAGQTIYGIGEGKDEILLGFVDNVLICSYSKTLMQKSLEQQKSPFYSHNGPFQSMRKKAYRRGNGKSLMKLHVNFEQVAKMAGVYMDEVSPSVVSLSQILEYASFDVKMENDYVDLEGTMNIDDSIPSLLTVMKTIERSEIRSHQILPYNTSFLLTFNFHDFDYFYSQISELMKEDEGFQEYEKMQNQIAGLLGVKRKGNKIERKRNKGKDVDYFDWIGQEIALALIPVNKTGSKQAYVAVIHSPDMENAQHDLDKLEKKIRTRSPVRFKSYDYKDHEIKYLKLKGFFKLFLGKMFKQFDKPKYAVLSDFVIFSNDTTALHRMIDVSNGQRANLPMKADYRSFFRKFEPNSNYFLYTKTPYLFPFLPTILDKESGRSLRKNEELVTSFRHAGLQLLSEDGHFVAKMHIEYDTSEVEGLFKSIEK